MSFDKEFQKCTILTAKKYFRDTGNVSFNSNEKRKRKTSFKGLAN